MIRLRTDFDSATEDEATALAEGVFVPLSVGEPIELYDADLHSVIGVVTAIADGLVCVRPDWSTWLDSPTAEFPDVDPKASLYVNGNAAMYETAGSGKKPEAVAV